MTRLKLQLSSFQGYHRCNNRTRIRTATGGVLAGVRPALPRIPSAPYSSVLRRGSSAALSSGMIYTYRYADIYMALQGSLEQVEEHKTLLRKQCLLSHNRIFMRMGGMLTYRFAPSG